MSTALYKNSVSTNYIKNKSFASLKDIKLRRKYQQYSLVSWLDFTACQHLGYFISKTFLFYSFFVGDGCHLGCYLYIISGDTSVGNWMFGIFVWFQFLLSCENSISVEGLYIQVCVQLFVDEVQI